MNGSNGRLRAISRGGAAWAKVVVGVSVKAAEGGAVVEGGLSGGITVTPSWRRGFLTASHGSVGILGASTR